MWDVLSTARLKPGSVILDTSGSMGRTLLAKALGAVASYSMSRDLLMARVVFCDATYYDQGYLSPEAIADRVRVKGRGGTVLRPAVDFLEAATCPLPPVDPCSISNDRSSADSCAPR